MLKLCSILKVIFSFTRNLANKLKKSRQIYFTDLSIRIALLGDVLYTDMKPETCLPHDGRNINDASPETPPSGTIPTKHRFC